MTVGIIFLIFVDFAVRFVWKQKLQIVTIRNCADLGVFRKSVTICCAFVTKIKMHGRFSSKTYKTSS
ncbi:hypothetical protein SDC9_167607 [bioreactor metagenome]|uniref:Uncharacterized protein n=1 Tax=bioreactor metagenome TaxID=1076179 RepID=A0A645G336_9ZZZZ